MYISYIDKNTGNIVTQISNVVTDKNKIELEKKSKFFYYLYDKALNLVEDGDVSVRYKTKYITKKDGSFRRIDIPDKELMQYQKEVSKIFYSKLGLLFPSSAYAYIKGRNSKQLAHIHTNQYEIIKLDIENFFGNCTFNFVLDSISNIYPFCLIDEKILKTIIMPCFVYYNNNYRLPQGAPTSPILSNIAMIPIDYNLQNNLPFWKYSRYADDMILSINSEHLYCYISPEEKLLIQIFGVEKNKHRISEDKVKEFTSLAIKETQRRLKRYNPDFSLNTKKTKVLKTDCGNVWMLGASVGEQVKIGNKKKQRLKATLWSFLNDCKSGKTWSKSDTRKLIGTLSYLKSIEPDFVINLIAKYKQKTGLDFYEEVQKILCM